MANPATTTTPDSLEETFAGEAFEPISAAERERLQRELAASTPYLAALMAHQG